MNKIKHPKRIKNIRNYLSEKKLDGIIISNEENRFYFSGLRSSAGFLFITMNDLYLFTDFRYTELASSEAPGWNIQKITSRLGWLPEIIKKLRVSNVGFESEFITVNTFNLIKDTINSSDVEVTLIPTTDIVLTLRAVKDEEEIKESFKCAKKFNLRGPTMEQPQYNLLFRDRFEKEYKDIFKKYKIGTTIWSPLASGLLTGKYNDGIPTKSRFKVKGYEWLADTIDKIDFNKIKKINLLAKKLGIKSSQLAILWCLKNKNVSSVILGASKLSQLKENLDSIKSYDLINDEILKEINSY